MGVAVRVAVIVAEGVAVDVAVGTGVEVARGVSVGVGTTDGVALGVAVGVGVGVSIIMDCPARQVGAHTDELRRLHEGRTGHALGLSIGVMEASAVLTSGFAEPKMPKKRPSGSLMPE